MRVVGVKLVIITDDIYARMSFFLDIDVVNIILGGGWIEHFLNSTKNYQSSLEKIRYRRRGEGRVWSLFHLMAPLTTKFDFLKLYYCRILSAHKQFNNLRNRKKAMRHDSQFAPL